MAFHLVQWLGEKLSLIDSTFVVCGQVFFLVRLIPGKCQDVLFLLLDVADAMSETHRSVPTKDARLKQMIDFQ